MKRLLIKSLVFLMVLSAQAAFSQDENAQGNANTTQFLLGGYGFVNFENEDGSPSNFESGFNPIFLWKLNDRVFFESEVEFELEDGGTAVALEYAQLFYVLNDYVTFGAGKYLSPINTFVERLHPTWINKLPTMPLGLSGHGGVPLMGGSQIGFQLRGAVNAGSGKVTYNGYVSNGATLNLPEEEVPGEEGGEEGGHGHGVGTAGTLNFNNTSDNNDNKAFGGRVAIIPFPQFEIGYGIESAKVGDQDSPYSDVKALTNVVDLGFTRDFGFLKGRIDIRGQYVWLNVDNPDVHPLEFENNSNAGYGQIAFQPYNLENPFLKNVEFVARFDRLDLPAGAPLNIDQERVSLGLNYWLAPSTVFKIAYENKTLMHEDEDETENVVIAQFSIGF